LVFIIKIIYIYSYNIYFIININIFITNIKNIFIKLFYLGIVEKLQNDAREFFISSLNQHDRKLIRKDDRRIVKVSY
jgi:hypothetical protein